MKLTLTPSETADLIPKIQHVLDTGKPWKDKTLHHPVEALVVAILTIDGIEREVIPGESHYGIVGFDTNGWQWDWLQQFKYKGKSYILSGSGYYGGHSFHLADK
jgi:hypothetical protein